MIPTREKSKDKQTDDGVRTTSKTSEMKLKSRRGLEESKGGRDGKRKETASVRV